MGRKSRTKPQAKPAHSDIAVQDVDTANTEDGFTDKQRAFIHHYFVCGFNGVEAYRLAGYGGDYDTMCAGASRLLSNDKVRGEINRRFQEFHLETQEVIARLSSQARGDVADLLDVNGDFDFKAAKAAGKTHLIKKYKRTKKTLEVGEGEGVVIEDKIEFELYDAQSALEKILKVISPQVQKVDVTSGGEPIKTVDVAAIIRDVREWEQQQREQPKP